MLLYISSLQFLPLNSLCTCSLAVAERSLHCVLRANFRLTPWLPVFRGSEASSCHTPLCTVARKLPKARLLYRSRNHHPAPLSILWHTGRPLLILFGNVQHLTSIANIRHLWYKRPVPNGKLRNRIIIVPRLPNLFGNGQHLTSIANIRHLWYKRPTPNGKNPSPVER